MTCLLMNLVFNMYIKSVIYIVLHYSYNESNSFVYNDIQRIIHKRAKSTLQLTGAIWDVTVTLF